MLRRIGNLRFCFFCGLSLLGLYFLLCITPVVYANNLTDSVIYHFSTSGGRQTTVWVKFNENKSCFSVLAGVGPIGAANPAPVRKMECVSAREIERMIDLDFSVSAQNSNDNPEDLMARVRALETRIMSERDPANMLQPQTKRPPRRQPASKPEGRKQSDDSNRLGGLGNDLEKQGSEDIKAMDSLYAR